MSAASPVGNLEGGVLAAGEPPARRFFRRSASLSSREDGGLETSMSKVGWGLELSFTEDGLRAFSRARRSSSCTGMVIYVFQGVLVHAGNYLYHECDSEQTNTS